MAPPERQTGLALPSSREVLKGGSAMFSVIGLLIAGLWWTDYSQWSYWWF